MKARFGMALSMVVGAALGGAAIQALHAQAKPPVDANGAVAAASATLPPLDPALRGVPLDPSWPKQLVVVTDSVLLDAAPTLAKSLPDWRVTVVGKSAQMIPVAIEALRRQPAATGPVAVVGLGHNSVWE